MNRFKRNHICVASSIPLLVLALALATGCQAQSPAKMETPAPSDASKVVKTNAEWQKLLSPEAFYVTRQAGTERPFTGEYTDHFEEGNYACVCCGQLLFESGQKFHSGCGWPAFSSTRAGALTEHNDLSHGMKRIEVRCSRCNAHLGHVFDDGPPPTHLRYCINSVAMTFVPKGEAPPAKP